MIDEKVLALLLVTLALVGCASEPAPEGAPPPVTLTAPRVPGGIERALFTPELVVAHADAIALTPGQRTQIADLTVTTQASLSRLDGDLDVATAALARALEESPIDEEAALTAARAVLVVEDEIKLVHLRMLVQLRNALTDEQQARLAHLRE